MDGLEEPNYDKAVRTLRVAASGPHYKFVQFLTALCAGMLGLSAPLQNTQTVANPLHAQLSLLALFALALSVICGVVALYGEKNAPNHRASELKRILKKHKGNRILAGKEANELGPVHAPLIHPLAFYAQCFLALAAVLLLLSSKTVLLIPSPTSTHPVQPTQPPAPKTTP